jgi:hypothetical protein
MNYQNTTPDNLMEIKSNELQNLQCNVIINKADIISTKFLHPEPALLGGMSRLWHPNDPPFYISVPASRSYSSI